MMREKYGLKALALCLLAVLSLMVVAAAGAQAKGDWKIEGSNTGVTKKVTGIIDKAGAIKDFSLLSKISGTTINLLCETFAVSDGLLFTDGSQLATLQFSNCTTFLNEVESKACDVEDEPIVLTVKSLLSLHNGKTYLLFSPDDGTLTFTKIRFGKLVGNECGFGPLISVTGHFVAQCLQSDGSIGCEKEEEAHLIEEVPNATSLFSAKDGSGKFIHQLSFGVNTVSLDGGVILSLPDDLGKKWSGLSLCL